MRLTCATLLLFAWQNGVHALNNPVRLKVAPRTLSVLRVKGGGRNRSNEKSERKFPFPRVRPLRNNEPRSEVPFVRPASEAPPSQVESIVKNAKSLQSNERDNPVKSSAVYIQAMAAGLAVSLAMVPEAIAFSFVAGVSPLVGLWTTVILGFFAALFGGRAGICSSASGACTVVVAALCASHSPVYLSACAILAGLFQVGGGFLGLGKFIRLVPHPVMLGFVNGLAVVMTKSQLTHFKNPSGAFFNPLEAVGGAMYGLTAATMVLVKLLPKIKATKAIPPSLGAVTLATVLAKVLNLPVKTLADVAGASTFTGGLAVLPKIGIPALPAFDLATLKIILPFAITMAAVGSIESLLTMQLLDGIADDGKRGSTSREVMAQGIGNIASGFTGGIGGCALLGQSIINMQSGGGVSRLSGVSMALFLALGIVAAAPLLGAVPVASLVGVMLLVCQSTFSWSSLRILNKIPKLDAFVIGLVSFVTVKDDLAKAVVIGTIVSALGFAWKQSMGITAISNLIPAEGINGETGPAPWKEYKLSGPLFFASTGQFSNIFNVKEDPDDVLIDFTASRVYDHSALEAINDLSDRYGAAGKRVHLRHLSNDCAKLLDKNHEGGLPPYEIIESDPDTDPVYGIASNSY